MNFCVDPLANNCLQCLRAATYNLPFSTTKATPYPVNSTRCFATFDFFYVISLGTSNPMDNPPSVMPPLRDLSLPQLLATPDELSLLTGHRDIDTFCYLDVTGQRFVFDRQMARSFLLGLLSGPQVKHARAMNTVAN